MEKGELKGRAVIAFSGARRIGTGSLVDVALLAKAVYETDPAANVLVLDAETSEPIEIDVRGSSEEVRSRLTRPPSEKSGPGRPKMGVTAKEITLLPRHWEWLATQRGGASAAIRRLVDEARHRSTAADEQRIGQKALYQFVTVIAGDAPGYEEALRALFAGNEAAFEAASEHWPNDVREHAQALAGKAFGRAASPFDGIIPHDRRHAVSRAIETAFPGEAVQTISRTTWGASGAGVFKIAINGEPYILRLDGPPDGFRDPQRQYACATIAAEAGIAPRLLYADVGSAVSIAEFIHGAEATFSRVERLNAVTNAVKRLHGTPLFPRHIDYMNGMDAILADLAKSLMLPEAALTTLLAGYARIRAVYPSDDDLVSSHNDLNPSNIIFAGARPWIIDWETAFAADRYVDIAALVNFFAADDVEEEHVLSRYFGAALNDDHRARFFLMKQVNRMFYTAALLNSGRALEPGLVVTDAVLATTRLAARKGPVSLATPESRVRFGCTFLNDASHDMRSPRFDEALNRVGATT